MTDIMSKEERSKRMSLIRSKWTKQEKWLHNHLKGNKIKHKMHPKISGSPDIILSNRKISIFLHGCFWHGCPKCYREPKSNTEFWREKIIKNKFRDKKSKRRLKKNGWEIITIWEHEIPVHDPKNATKRIIEKIKNI